MQPLHPTTKSSHTKTCHDIFIADVITPSVITEKQYNTSEAPSIINEKGIPIHNTWSVYNSYFVTILRIGLSPYNTKQLTKDAAEVMVLG